MNGMPRRSSQQGVALAIALILLTVLTLISIFAASTGGLELRMARNMQDSMDSFQSAEAGVNAVHSLVRTGPHPFDGDDSLDPFAGLAPNPLDQLNDGAASVDVDVRLLLEEVPCPRATRGYSVDLVLCDHYRVESRHTSPDARSRIDQGVANPVIGSASF